MERKASAHLAAAFALALAGCGTAVNCGGVLDPGAPRCVYGGVSLDRRWGAHFFTTAFQGPYPENATVCNRLLAGSFAFGCGVGVLAVDLPLSVAADTLTLPLTIPTAIHRWNQAICSPDLGNAADAAGEIPLPPPEVIEPPPNPARGKRRDDSTPPLSHRGDFTRQRFSGALHWTSLHRLNHRRPQREETP